jgi:hypothetical protein
VNNPLNPNVDPWYVQQHLDSLSRAGVGRRAVAEACDLDPSTVGKIRSGQRKFIRMGTALQILSVTADAPLDNALIDARPAMKQIGELLKEGFTKKELATRLGYRNQQLQYHSGRRMTARNVARVDRFYRRTMAGAA